MQNRRNNKKIPPYFARLENAGAALLFAVLAFIIRPENTAGATEGPFTFSLINGGQAARITGYSGSPVNLNIPDTLGGKSVTEIGEDAFFGKDFLESVNFPDSLVSIKEFAFFRCTALRQVTLPNAVTSLGNGVFQNCIRMTKAAISASVTSIGAVPFLGCTSLRQIEVHSNNLHYASQDGVLFNKQKTQLWQYPNGKSGPYTLPGSVERIGASAFSFSVTLTEVTIPAGIKFIGENAFRRCSRLIKALFEGDAPNTVNAGAFDFTAAGFKVQFYEGASGFTAPMWTTSGGGSYPSESVASSSFSAWLNSFGLAADDLAANGDPLLIAYALNLNPTNSAAFLPLPSVESGTFRLDFPVDRSDVLVGLERSTDLTSSVWESVGVTTNSGTASVSIPLVGSESPEKLYLRFTAQEE